MPRRETVELNTHLLAERVAALDMKQWVIATRLGVARRSLSRWLSGEVKKISRSNLDKLAELLGCTAEDLAAAEDAPPFATRADQSQAARNIVKDSAESIFNTTENYELYESLIKATLHPDLTHKQLGVLYSRMQIASAKQRKYDEARKYGLLSLEHSRKAGDTGHEAAAQMNLALIEAECGQLDRALEAMLEARNYAHSLGRPRQAISVERNLAEIYWVMGDFDSAAHSMRAAYPVTSKTGDLLVRAGTLLVSGMIMLDVGDEAGAFELMEAAATVPANPPLIRITAESRLWQAFILARRGETEAALALARQSVETLARFNYFELCYNILFARVLRLCGEVKEAQTVVLAGLSAPYTRPYEVPFLYQEQAQNAAALGEQTVARKLRLKAAKSFKACGMPLRAEALL